MAASKTIVEARGIHKHFGTLHVLKGVDLKVAERELEFVIGPSGSGKSTLLRCLNRLPEPSSGGGVGASTARPAPPTPTTHPPHRTPLLFPPFPPHPHP